MVNPHLLTLEDFWEAEEALRLNERAITLRSTAEYLGTTIGVIRNRRVGMGPTRERPCICIVCQPERYAAEGCEAARLVNTGKPHPWSEVARQKMSESMRGRKYSPLSLERRRLTKVTHETERQRKDLLYTQLFMEQEGTCAICKSQDSKSGRVSHKKLCMDHDYVAAEKHGHKRGYFCVEEVRGLLCFSCNRFCGWLDDITKVDPRQRVGWQAIAYIERTRK